MNPKSGMSGAITEELVHPEGSTTLKESDLPGVKGQEKQEPGPTLALGQQAEHFMKNSAAQEAIRRLRLNLHNAFGRCDANNVAGMQEIRRTLSVVDAFEGLLEQMVGDAQIVKADIARNEKEKKH